MSRKSFDPDAADDAPAAARDEAARRPCRFCNFPTLTSILSQYGTRCFRCYEAYCSMPQPAPATAANNIADKKAWAWALKAREERDPTGMSLAQRTMWREALRPELARQKAAAEGAAA